MTLNLRAALQQFPELTLCVSRQYAIVTAFRAFSREWCRSVHNQSAAQLGLALADTTKMTITAAVFVYCGGSRALMFFSSSFSCRTSSSKRSRREAEAIEGPVIDSSGGAGNVTAPLNRCA